MSIQREPRIPGGPADVVRKLRVGRRLCAQFGFRQRAGRLAWGGYLYASARNRLVWRLTPSTLNPAVQPAGPWGGVASGEGGYISGLPGLLAPELGAQPGALVAHTHHAVFWGGGKAHTHIQRISGAYPANIWTSSAPARSQFLRSLPGGPPAAAVDSNTAQRCGVQRGE